MFPGFESRDADSCSAAGEKKDAINHWAAQVRELEQKKLC